MVASYSDRTRNFAVHSRRKFLTQAGVLAAGTMGAPALPEAQRWYGTNDSINAWRKVRVPHTWQVDSAFIDDRGVAWYRRTFDALSEWQNSAVRIEFEAVFHTATIWVNGELAGEHVRKGYTAFVLAITYLLRWGRSNTIAVRVDNAFNGHMVPRGGSSDWALDGGIYRPVQLLITPKTFVERVDLEAFPDLASGDGKLTITAYVRNTGSKSWMGRAYFRIIDDET